MKFVFIVTAFNAAEWCKRNLESIFSQTYNKYRVIYVDDCSTDNTTSLISEYKIQLIKNKTRCYQTYNRWIAYHLCDDDEICIMLDGDDWLVDEYVLDYLNFIYHENDILCTYGQFKLFYQGFQKEVYATRSYPEEIKNESTYRSYDFIAYHLRTGYAGLFKKIPSEYLMYKGQWLDRCSDVAEMLCVLELSGNKNMNSGKTLYTYNKNNSMKYSNSPFLDKTRQEYEKHVRQLKPLRSEKNVSFN